MKDQLSNSDFVLAALSGSSESVAGEKWEAIYLEFRNHLTSYLLSGEKYYNVFLALRDLNYSFRTSAAGGGKTAAA